MVPSTYPQESCRPGCPCACLTLPLSPIQELSPIQLPLLICNWSALVFAPFKQAKPSPAKPSPVKSSAFQRLHLHACYGLIGAEQAGAAAYLAHRFFDKQQQQAEHLQFIDAPTKKGSSQNCRPLLEAQKKVLFLWFVLHFSFIFFLFFLGSFYVIACRRVKREELPAVAGVADFWATFAHLTHAYCGTSSPNWDTTRGQKPVRASRQPKAFNLLLLYSHDLLEIVRSIALSVCLISSKRGNTLRDCINCRKSLSLSLRSLWSLDSCDFIVILFDRRKCSKKGILSLWNAF